MNPYQLAPLQLGPAHHQVPQQRFAPVYDITHPAEPRPPPPPPPVEHNKSTPANGSGTGNKRKAGKAPAKGKGKASGNKSTPNAGEESESDGSGEEEEENGRKRKRHRMALSCKSCKKRKIKCDRAMPACGPCERRGKPDECTWDLFSAPSGGLDGYLPPSIARTADLDAVVARLAHVEAYLKTLPPNLASFAPYAPPLPSGGVGDATRKFIANGGPETGAAGAEGKEETFWETEDAAVNLENGVFGATTKRDGAGGRLLLGSGSGGSGAIPAGSHGGGASSHGRPARFGAPSVELTKALTSIVAPERSADSLSRAHLPVEFDASPAELERARKEEVRRIFRALPGKPAIDHLVRMYFERVSWLFHHLHAPSFLIEVEEFHVMCETGRNTEVDPLFLALLLMVLCVSLDSTHASRSPLSLDTTVADTSGPLSQFSDEQLRNLPERWFAAAQRALSLGEWETVPRIRSIQTIVLFTQFLQLCSANRGQPSQLVTWLAGGIRLAQVLGLHLLGSNPEVMPPDDPAFPPGKCSLKRESAKRLWGVLVYQDWLGASSKNRSYLISPFHFDTDDPLNLNDSDLSSIDWKVNPSPDSVLTDSSSDRVRIAMSRQVRKVFDAVVLTKDFTYETVLELDQGYRAILDKLPDRWTLESSAEETEQPMLRFQRHFALEGLHNRIFRLHRPFSTRGYSQVKYRFSTDACIRSARVVVVSTHNIIASAKDIWYVYSHVMGAALVLFNDLFQSIDHDASASEIDSKKDTLTLAFEIFSRSSEIMSPSLQSVVQQGAKIMQGLFRAEESRRVGRAAQTLLSASGVGAPPEGDDDVESFADVLQRISRSLNTQTAPHRGTPPPTRNIPSAATARNLSLPNTTSSAPVASFPPFPSTNMPPTSTNFDTTPWPFPSVPEAADVLSLQFFQELDLDMNAPLVPSATGNVDFWGGSGAGGAFGALGASFAMPVDGGSGNQEWAADGGGVAGSFGGREGGTGADGLSSLFGQVSGGW